MKMISFFSSFVVSFFVLTTVIAFPGDDVIIEMGGVVAGRLKENASEKESKHGEPARDVVLSVAVAAAAPRVSQQAPAAMVEQPLLPRNGVRVSKPKRLVWSKRNWQQGNSRIPLNKDYTWSLRLDYQDLYQVNFPPEVQGFKRTLMSLQFRCVRGGVEFGLYNMEGNLQLDPDGLPLRAVLPPNSKGSYKVRFEFEPHANLHLRIRAHLDEDISSEIAIHGLTCEALKEPTGERLPLKPEKLFITESKFFSSGPEELLEAILLDFLPVRDLRICQHVCKSWKRVVIDASKRKEVDSHPVNLGPEASAQFLNLLQRHGAGPERDPHKVDALCDYLLKCKSVHASGAVSWANALMLLHEVKPDRVPSILKFLTDGFQPFKWTIFENWLALLDMPFAYSPPEYLVPFKEQIDNLANNKGPYQWEAIEYRIGGHSAGCYGYRRDPEAARRELDSFADKPGPYQWKAILKRIGNHASGLNGYEKDPEAARRELDSFADKPGRYQWEAILERIRSRANGWNGYRRDSEGARRELDSLADKPGPYQEQAIYLCVRSYGGHLYGFEKNFDKVRELINAISFREFIEDEGDSPAAARADSGGGRPHILINAGRVFFDQFRKFCARPKVLHIE